MRSLLITVVSLCLIVPARLEPSGKLTQEWVVATQLKPTAETPTKGNLLIIQPVYSGSHLFILTDIAKKLAKIGYKTTFLRFKTSQMVSTTPLNI